MAEIDQDHNLDSINSEEEALYTNRQFVVTSKARKTIRQSSLRSLIILITFILTIIGIYGYESQRRRALLQQKKTFKNLIIYKHDGQGIILPYARPLAIKSSLIKQQEEAKNIYYQQNNEFLDYTRFLGEGRQFCVKLYNNGWFQSDANIFKAEYYKLNKTYSLDNYEMERGFCVVGWLPSDIDNITADFLDVFLLSINEQNYTNYRVYLVDDTNNIANTKNNLLGKILKMSQKYPKLSNRLWVLKNINKIGKLGSRDIVIRNYCLPKQIIVDISPFDNLVGKQVFNLLNRIYSKNQSTWSVFSNYDSIREKKARQVKADSFKYLNQIQPGTNISKLKQIMLNGTKYRQSDLQVSGYLKTYLRQIYMRIPMSHLLQRSNARYHQFAADHFVTYSIAELSGEPHTVILPQSYMIHFDELVDKYQENSQCQKIYYNYAKYKSKVLIGQQVLQSLESPIKLTDDPIFEASRVNYIEVEKQYKLCISREKKIDNIFH